MSEGTRSFNESKNNKDTADPRDVNVAVSGQTKRRRLRWADNHDRVLTQTVVSDRLHYSVNYNSTMNMQTSQVIDNNGDGNTTSGATGEPQPQIQECCIISWSPGSDYWLVGTQGAHSRLLSPLLPQSTVFRILGEDVTGWCHLPVASPRSNRVQFMPRGFILQHFQHSTGTIVAAARNCNAEEEAWIGAGKSGCS